MSKETLDAAEALIKQFGFETDYTAEHELGRGRFAIVKRCVNKATGKRYAAKLVKKSRSNTHGRSGREQLLMEISILHKSNHPKMVRLYDVYETRGEMQLILEYAEGGDLHRHCIESDQIRTEKEICYLIRQILQATRYLHGEHIVHLDLKPDNILLAKKDEVFPEIRLIDFGLSRSLEGPYSQFDIVGTAEYVSPEVLAFDPIDYGSDMWSIGVVTYVLLSGISPFAGDDVMETYANIGLVDYDFDCEEFDDISDAALDFMEKLLVRDPKKRMSARESLEHEWIKQLDGGLSTHDVMQAQLAKKDALPEDLEISPPQDDDDFATSSESEASSADGNDKDEVVEDEVRESGLGDVEQQSKKVMTEKRKDEVMTKESKEEVLPEKSKDEVRTQEPKNEVPTPEPKNEVRTPEPKDEVRTPEPKDEVRTQVPKDEVRTQPKNEVRTQEPKNDLRTQESKDEVRTQEPKVLNKESQDKVSNKELQDKVPNKELQDKVPNKELQNNVFSDESSVENEKAEKREEITTNKTNKSDSISQHKEFKSNGEVSTNKKEINEEIATTEESHTINGDLTKKRGIGNKMAKFSMKPSVEAPAPKNEKFSRFKSGKPLNTAFLSQDKTEKKPEKKPFSISKGNKFERTSNVKPPEDGMHSTPSSNKSSATNSPVMARKSSPTGSTPSSNRSSASNSPVIARKSQSSAPSSNKSSATSSPEIPRKSPQVNGTTEKLQGSGNKLQELGATEKLQGSGNNSEDITPPTEKSGAIKETEKTYAFKNKAPAVPAKKSVEESAKHPPPVKKAKPVGGLAAKMAKFNKPDNSSSAQSPAPKMNSKFDRKTVSDKSANSGDDSKKKIVKDVDDSSDDFKNKIVKDADNSSDDLKKKIVKDADNSSDDFKKKIVKDADNSSDEFKKRIVKDADDSSDDFKKKIVKDVDDSDSNEQALNGSLSNPDSLIRNDKHNDEQVNNKFMQQNLDVTTKSKSPPPTANKPKSPIINKPKSIIPKYEITCTPMFEIPSNPKPSPPKPESPILRRKPSPKPAPPPLNPESPTPEHNYEPPTREHTKESATVEPESRTAEPQLPPEPESFAAETELPPCGRKIPPPSITPKPKAKPFKKPPEVALKPIRSPPPSHVSAQEESGKITSGAQEEFDKNTSSAQEESDKSNSTECEEKDTIKPLKPKVGSGLKLNLSIGGGNSAAGKKLNISPLVSVADRPNDHGSTEKASMIRQMTLGCSEELNPRRVTLAETRSKNESFSRGRRSLTNEDSHRKTYRRLYVTKVRNSKVYEEDIDSSTDAVKIVQRVDKDVLQVEVKLKSTDLKLLP